MRNILINSLNGLAADDIPMFLFQLLVGGALIRLVQLAWYKKFNVLYSKHYLLIGLAFMLMAIIAKYSVPFAILSVGVILSIGKSEIKDENIRTLKLIIGLIGIGIGSFDIVLTSIFVVLILLVIWFFPNKSNG